MHDYIVLDRHVTHVRECFILLAAAIAKNTYVNSCTPVRVSFGLLTLRKQVLGLSSLSVGPLPQDSSSVSRLNMLLIDLRLAQ